ncbi:MAG: hypothetical protein O2840_01920 [bacterium]|nr:hypothetical protein [bacterium]
MQRISATPSVQVKITLPAQLQHFVQEKADIYGLTVATYIKHLVLDDIKDSSMKTFPMSRKTEQVALQAIKDHKQGKTHEIRDVDEFLSSL